MINHTCALLTAVINSFSAIFSRWTWYRTTGLNEMLLAQYK